MMDPYTIGLCKLVGAVPLLFLSALASAEQFVVAQRCSSAVNELIQVEVTPFHVHLGLKRHVQLVKRPHEHGFGR